MTSEPDRGLETDHLDQLLETPAPAPAQPVVVVQYRDRGMPIWIIIPIVLVVMAVALFVYDRTVTKPALIRAEADRSLLQRQFKEELALTTVRDSAPTKAVLPVPAAYASENSAGVSGPAANTSVPPTADVKHAVKAGSQENPPAASPVASVTTPTPAPAGSAVSMPPLATAAEGGAGTSPNAAAAIAADANSRVGDFEDTTANPIRSGVLDPFAALDKGLPPPEGYNADVRTASADSPGPPSGMAAGEAAPGRQTGAGPAGGSPAAGALVANGGTAGPRALAPLPTKEEMEDSINKEAAERDAAMKRQIADRNAEARAQVVGEQLKFREELRELLKAKGPKTGQDIKLLDKRYDVDLNPDVRLQAMAVWRHSRKSKEEKLRFVRSLGVPETAILQFICGSLDPLVGTRNGPRDRNEVWVRAAEQLLRFEPPQAGPGPQPASGEAAGTASTRRRVVSTPSN